jgi:hypothetical protein
MIASGASVRIAWPHLLVARQVDVRPASKVVTSWLPDRRAVISSDQVARRAGDEQPHFLTRSLTAARVSRSTSRRRKVSRLS